MKKKSVKKVNITINHLAELVSANNVHIEKLSEKIDKLSDVVKGNTDDIKILSIRLDESIDGLATSTQQRFDEMEENFEETLRTEIGVVHIEMKNINNRLDIIEGARYHAHETRIENLEDSMRTVKTKLKIK